MEKRLLMILCVHTLALVAADILTALSHGRASATDVPVAVCSRANTAQQVSHNEQAGLGIFSALVAPLQPQVCAILPRAFYFIHLAAEAQRASRLNINSMLSDNELRIGRCIQTLIRVENYFLKKTFKFLKKDSEVESTEGWDKL
jgi:hypothetical protein